MGALEGFTANQIVSVANLTSMVNMLPALQVTTVSVNPAASGTMYQCQPAGGAQIVITLPTPTPFAVVGVKLDATSGSVQVIHNASEYILSPLGDTTFRTNASITISNPDSYLILQSDGTNWHEIASNVPISDQAVAGTPVTTSDTTTSTAYTATLSTHSGPSCSIVTGTTCFVMISADCANATSGDGAFMSFAVSGATTIAATDAMCIGIVEASTTNPAYLGAIFLVTGLTPGVNTFTANYRASGGGTATFTNRRITAFTG